MLLRFIKEKINLDTQSKTLFKNSTWVFISNAIGAILALLRSVVIARGLGAEIFGTYAIVVAFTGFVIEFLNLNTGTALIKYGAGFIAEDRTDKLTAMLKKSIRVTVVMAGVAIVVIAILINVSYSTFIEKPGLSWFIIAYAVAASIQYINSISRGMLRLYFKFKINSIIQIVMDVVETGVIVACVFLFHKNIAMFFIAVIITRFLNGLICNLIAFWELRKVLIPYIHVSENIIGEEEKEIKKFVIGNSLGNTLKTVMAQGDILLLGALAGPTSVAFYSVAKKLAYSILTLTDPLVTSIYPQFTKLIAEHKFSEAKKLISKIVSLAAIPSLLFLVSTFFLSDWIIFIVYGKNYAGAGSPFFYSMLNAVIGSVLFWTLPLLQSLGLIKTRLKVYALAIIAGLISAVVLIPKMAATGMAISLLLVNLIIHAGFIYSAFKRMKLRESTRV